LATGDRCDIGGVTSALEFTLNWHVYIILCSDETLYTGITTDVERRMREHASGRGAKYFRGREPKELLYLESGHDRSTASKRELSIKGMKRAEKHQLITSTNTDAAGPRQE
jgi:putative endonuclease